MSYPSRHAPRRGSSTGRHGNVRRLGPANSRQAAVVGNAVFLLLALAIGGLLVSVAYIFTSTSAMPTIGAADQSIQTPSTSGDTWIPLHSQAPADIIAAARQSPLFQEPRTGSGDHVRDLSRLGRPVFVQALRPAGVSAAEVPDFYIVPILNQVGAATDAAELALNPSHTAVQVIAIVTYTMPHANGSVANLQANQAVHAVATQRQEAEQGIGQPHLVYFPLDPAWQVSQYGQHMWTAGGELPADPVWLVTATDKKQYLAGDDGRLYLVSQLPFWHGQ
jgi:hypothetical protein